MAEKLTNKRVATLIAAGKKIHVSDSQTRGLVLRIESAAYYTWNVRRSVGDRDHRLDLTNVWSLDEARELALEVDRRVRAKRDPWIMAPGEWQRFFEERHRKKLGVEKPVYVPPPFEHVVPNGPLMLWPDAVREFLADISTSLRPKSVDDYRKSLNVAEFKRFELEFVSAITVEQMAVAVDDIRKRGVEKQAQKCRAIARLFFKWLGSNANRPRTGVAAQVMHGLEKPKLTLVEDNGQKPNPPKGSVRVPSPRDLGRLLRAFTDVESPVRERDRLAALLTLYSVQRRYTVAQARKSEFEPAAGGGLWTIPPAHRKSASEKKRRNLEVGMHVVPLPPRAWAAVKRAMALSETEYMFPSLRERRAGKPSVRMDESIVTQTFLGVTGNVCGPHDMRRGFGTTYGNEVDLDESLAKSVYDHSGGVKSGDVTRTHYMFKSGEHRLWPVMIGWADYLDRCAELKD